jgi:UDP-N-acetylglucosamine 2-epimerase
MRKVANPFGDGRSARRIAQAVATRLVVPDEAAAVAA